MRSWHDYHLTGYAVDGAAGRISFDVHWPYETDTDIHRARVVFSGVLGYFFQHDLGGNILYAIEQAPVEPFIRENTAWFEREQKWGWPLFWKGSAEATLAHVVERGAKLFDISTSYGLSGWILATSVEQSATDA